MAADDTTLMVGLGVGFVLAVVVLVALFRWSDGPSAKDPRFHARPNHGSIIDAIIDVISDLLD